MGEIYDLILVENQKQEMTRVLECNGKTEQFGLTLTQEGAAELMVCRQDSLKRHRRVEFGEGILPKLIFTFCDSQYLEQDAYQETLAKLQDIFYEYKNEAQDKMTDDELLAFMKEQFETVCCGSTQQLAGTCLERLARALRAGYVSRAQRGLKDEYVLRETSEEYTGLSEENGWDRELYWKALEDEMG